MKDINISFIDMLLKAVCAMTEGGMEVAMENSLKRHIYE